MPLVSRLLLFVNMFHRLFYFTTEDQISVIYLKKKEVQKHKLNIVTEYFWGSNNDINVCIGEIVK